MGRRRTKPKKYQNGTGIQWAECTPKQKTVLVLIWYVVVANFAAWLGWATVSLWIGGLILVAILLRCIKIKIGTN